MDSGTIAQARKINFQQLLDTLDTATGPDSTDVEFIIGELNLPGGNCRSDPDVDHKIVARKAVNKGLDSEGVKSRVQDKIGHRPGEGLPGFTHRTRK